MGLITSNTHVT